MRTQFSKKKRKSWRCWGSRRKNAIVNIKTSIKSVWLFDENDLNYSAWLLRLVVQTKKSSIFSLGLHVILFYSDSIRQLKICLPFHKSIFHIKVWTYLWMCSIEPRSVSVFWNIKLMKQKEQHFSYIRPN